MNKKIIAIFALLALSKLATGAVYGFEVKNDTNKSDNPREVLYIPTKPIMGKICSRYKTKGSRKVKTGKHKKEDTHSGKRAIAWCYLPKTLPTGWRSETADWWETEHYGTCNEHIWKHIKEHAQQRRGDQRESQVLR